MTIRWIFEDPDTAETYVHEVNPNTMSSPFRGHNTTAMIGALSFRRRSEPRDWTFGGNIRTKAHYDALLDWSQRPGKTLVTDHLGRTFEVFLVEFVPQEKTPTPRTSWRFTYTMRALMLNYLGAP